MRLTEKPQITFHNTPQAQLPPSDSSTSPAVQVAQSAIAQGSALVAEVKPLPQGTFNTNYAHLVARVDSILALKGDFDSDLEKLSSTVKNEVDQIKSLKTEFESATIKREKLSNDYDIKQEDITRSSFVIAEMLKKYTKAFAFFEGVGQFEEYDPDEEYVDQYEDQYTNLSEGIVKVRQLQPCALDDETLNKLEEFISTAALFKELKENHNLHFSKKLEHLKFLQNFLTLFETIFKDQDDDVFVVGEDEVEPINLTQDETQSEENPLREIEDFYEWFKDVLYQERYYARLQEKMAYQRVYKAFEEYYGESTVWVFSEFKNYRNQLKVAINSKEEFEKLVEDDFFYNFGVFLEEIINAFDEQLDFLDETEEWDRDSDIKFTISVLEREKERFEEIQSQFNNLIQVYKDYHRQNQQLQDLIHAHSQIDENCYKAQQRLHQAIVDLSNGKSKFLNDTVTSKDLQEDVKVKSQNLLDLFRKKQIAKAIEDPDPSPLNVLKERRKKREEAVEKAIKSKKDAIDPFIELYVMQKRIDKVNIEDCNIIEMFSAKDVRLKHAEKRNWAFARYSDNNHNGLNRNIVVKTDNNNPVDTPLIYLISKLSKEALNCHGILNLSEKGINNFEAGALKLMTYSQQNVIDRHRYEELIATTNTEIVTTPSEEVVGEDIEYYSRFAIPPIKAFATYLTKAKANLNIGFLKKVHTALVMSIAYAFTNDDLRRWLSLPGGHPIASVIVSKEGEILSWSVNTIGDPKQQDLVRHAEVNALKAYFQRNKSENALPNDALIFTSLKPCCMCAGAIYDVAKQNNLNLEVIYCQDDPGNNAVKTVFETSGFIVEKASYFIDKSDMLKVLDQEFLKAKAATETSLTGAETFKVPELRNIGKVFVFEMKKLVDAGGANDQEKAYLDYIAQFMQINSILNVV